VPSRTPGRLIERGERFGLPLEPRHTFGIIRKRLGEDLDGHVAIDLRIAGAVDLTHPAGPTGRLDLICADPRARRQAHDRIRRL
jgi:hypothetical protein